MIDGGEKVYNDSYAAIDIPVQLLYASEGLVEGSHELVFTNEAKSHKPWQESDGGSPRVCMSICQASGRSG